MQTPDNGQKLKAQKSLNTAEVCSDRPDVSVVTVVVVGHSRVRKSAYSIGASSNCEWLLLYNNIRIVWLQSSRISINGSIGQLLQS